MKKNLTKDENKKNYAQLANISASGALGVGIATVDIFNPEAGLVILGISTIIKILAHYGFERYRSNPDIVIKSIVKEAMERAHLKESEKKWCEPQAIDVLKKFEINISQLIMDSQYITNLSKDLCKSFKGEEKDIFLKTIENAINEIVKKLMSTEEFKVELLKTAQSGFTELETIKNLIRQIKEDDMRQLYSFERYGALSVNPPVLPINIIEHPQYKMIKKILDNEQRILINSEVGGIGKSTVCKALYKDIHQNDEKRIMAWVNYSGHGLISDLKRDLAYPSQKNKQDWEERLSYFLQKEISEDAIIFIDNMNVLEENEPDFRIIANAKCKIVCSSRTKHFDNFKSITLNHLEIEDCINIFLRYFYEEKDYKSLYVNETIKKDIERIVRRAGLNTLIIEILAKNARKNRIGIDNLSQFINILDEKKFDLDGTIKLKDGSGNIVNDKIVNHLKRIFPVEKLSEHDKAFLYCISCLPDGVIKKEIGEWIVNDSRRTDIIANLDENGWVKWDESGYYMHPIIKDVIQIVINYPSTPMTYFMCEMMKKTRFSQNLSYELRITYNTYLECLVDKLEDKWKSFSIDEKYIICNLIYNISTFYYVNGNYDQSEKYINLVKEKVTPLFNEFELSLQMCKESKDNINILEIKKKYYRWSDIVISIHKHAGNIYANRFKSNTLEAKYIDKAIEEYNYIKPYLHNLMKIRDTLLFKEIYLGEIYSDDPFVTRINYQAIALLGNAYIKKSEVVSDSERDSLLREAKKYLREAVRGLDKLIKEIDDETNEIEERLRFDNAANTYIYYGNLYIQEKKYNLALKKYTNAKDLLYHIKENDPEMLTSLAHEKIAETHYYMLKNLQRFDARRHHYEMCGDNIVQAKRLRQIGIKKNSMRFFMDSLVELESKKEELADEYGIK